jgi:hypothetical protein
VDYYLIPSIQERISIFRLIFLRMLNKWKKVRGKEPADDELMFEEALKNEVTYRKSLGKEYIRRYVDVEFEKFKRKR